MQELIPTNSVGNPFDLTGLLYNEADYEKVLQRYLESPVYDTVLVLSSMLGPASEKFNGPLDGPLRRAAGTPGKRLIIASSTACAVGAVDGEVPRRRRGHRSWHRAHRPQPEGHGYLPRTAGPARSRRR